MKAWDDVLRAWGATAIGLCVACGGGDGVTPAPEDEVEELFESVGARSVSALVSKRGAALLLEGKARVSVPIGALEVEENIRVRTGATKDLAPIPRQFELLGDPIIVTPHGLRMGRPARVMLTVDDLETPDARLGMLRLSDEEDQTWSEMKGVTRVAADAPEPDNEGYRRSEEKDSLEDRRRMYAMVDTFSVFQAVRLMTGICTGKSEGEVCRPAAGACDVAETCDGTSAECPEDSLAEAGTVCTEADTCVAEAVCSGETPVCPDAAPMPSGTACDDGLFCTTTDTCDGEGVCAGSGDPCAEHLEDGDDNCSESCVEVAGDFACNGPDVDGTTCDVGNTCAASECTAGSCVKVAACPIFVDAKAGEDVAGCGADWATACATVQQGSDRAVEEQNPRVFVAAGEYLAASTTEPVLTMAEGVAYYGSFLGTELHQDERVDLSDEANVVSSSVLNGQGSETSIVQGASDARLDGFTVTGGGAFEGAGMHNAGIGNLIVANTYFYANSTYGSGARGAGMFNGVVDGLRVENVTFESNSLGDGSDLRGGAMFNQDGSDLQILDSVFVMNAVNGDKAEGGAVYNEKIDVLKLTRVDFLQNEVSGTTDVAGGAMVSVSSNQVLEDVRFELCKAQGSGTVRGGALADLDTQSDLRNVTFLGNVALADFSNPAEGGAYAVSGTIATDTLLDTVLFSGNGAAGANASVRGGGMFVDQQGQGFDSLVRITNSRFEKNQVDSSSSKGGPPSLGGGLCAVGGGLDLSLAQVHFDGNSVYAGFSVEGRGGGLHSDARDTNLVDSSFLNNEVSGGTNVGVAGGGAFFEAGTFTAEGVQFVRNFLYGDVCEGLSAFGAGLGSKSGGMTVRGSDFIGNEANDYSGCGLATGGGLAHEGGLATVVNAGFFGNFATDGGGAWLDGTNDFSVVNASFVGNSALYSGQHLYAQNGTGTIRNTATLADDLNGIDSDRLIVLTTEANCESNTGTDFESVASGHVFLTPVSTCLDAAVDKFADAAFTGTAWNALSTLADGTPDGTPVDAGRHYRADQLRIVELAYDGQTQVRWRVHGSPSTRCILSGYSLAPYEVPAALTASGTYTVSGTGSEGGFKLVCRDGGQMAAADDSSGQVTSPSF